MLDNEKETGISYLRLKTWWSIGCYNLKRRVDFWIIVKNCLKRLFGIKIKRVVKVKTIILKS